LSRWLQHGKALGGLAALSLALVAPYAVEPLAAGRPRAAAAFLFLAGALFLVGLLSRIAYFIAGVVLALGAVLLQHVKRHWGFGQLDSRLEAFYESPPGEILEYLRSHVDAIDIALLAAAIVLCVLAARLPRLGAGSFVRQRTIALACLAAWVAVAALLRFDVPYRNFPLATLASQAVDARERYAQLTARAEALRRAPVQPQSCTLRYKRVVIVLGESAVPDHMSVFGYAKPTTPFAQRSQPYAFDALSPANQTRYALAMMLTAAAPDNFDVFFRSHSLVGQLRACGMKTLWISNQGRRGRYDSFASSIGLEADESVFLNDWSWTAVSYDGAIVDELRRRGVDKRGRQAVFVHLIGSHAKYRERFPPGFGFPDVSHVVEQYDNSLLYTDHVLARLHELLYDDATLFVYVSDHGQIVSDSAFGSGFLPGYREEFRSPLLIWTSDGPSMARVRSELGTARLNLESFDNLISFLAGMSPSPGLSTRDLVAVLGPEHLRRYRQLASFGDPR
jgi:glucan phosphoethanolaminetransferase (alkaline phosphatase superfamily)